MADVTLTPADDAKVAEAIRAAELRTDGEIQAIVAQTSDTYLDIVLYAALLLALLPLAIAAAVPRLLSRAVDMVFGNWGEETALHLLLTAVLVMVIAAFFLGRYLFALPRIRMALTPAGIKASRVRRRAIDLFKTGTEARTATATGVLLYLSLAEHRAEIVADKSIHAKVDAALWGEAMAALLAGIKDNRAGDGIADAIGKIADVLAEHFPHTGEDPNELPDRLLRL